jgi:polyhydroxybutyrate depolymerase
MGFLRKVVYATFSKIPKVDPKKVYWVGHSNGCAMAQAMAANASDIVTAVGCASFYLLTPVAATYSPVPIMVVHGTLDDWVKPPSPPPYQDGVPYANSQLRFPGQTMYYNITGAVSNIDVWAKLNNCTGAPVETMDSKKKTRFYSNCSQNAQVNLLSVVAGKHIPYLKTGETTIDPTAMVWDFMKQFVKVTATTPVTVNYTVTNPQKLLASSASAQGCMLAVVTPLAALFLF